jgi:hypothetical protein
MEPKRTTPPAGTVALETPAAVAEVKRPRGGQS